ncbi:MAG: hypothetical protein WAO69_17445, partial [Aestuariivita sp.]|uniref:hypothetical protein n=1 Tax=Aestuariivita sp. TaxID=1872407 RepID=UPI003BAEAEE8
MIGLLSPLSLMLLCWTLTGLIGGYTLAHLDQLELVQIFLRREGLDLGAFSIMGMVWIGIGMLSYIVGDLAARITLPPPRCARIDLDLNRAAQLTFAINLFLLGVTAMWIATSAAQKGGLIQLAAAVYVDNLTTRDLLLENKLFTGMRLFYAALPATGCLAAAILCARRLRRQSRRLCQITIALNIAALFILPIVMSQRLLLLQLVLAAYLAACLAKGRIFGLPWLSVGVVLFLTLWLAREAVTNPFHDGSTTGLAFQKLAFYVVNDLWNSFAPISQPIPHTYGKLTFEGVMFLTFTDSYFLSTLDPKMELLDTVLGGGEFPFFTSAFVDFGPAI